jgi:hypothetical protein
VYFEKRRVIIEKYLLDMHKEGQDAYDKIKTFFSAKEPLRLFRNSYLYHYPNDKYVEWAFNAATEDEPWEWYFSEASTNSFYFSCELTLNHGLMIAASETTLYKAFDAVMARAMELANTMPDFLMRLIETIGFRYLGNDIFKPRKKTIISDAPEPAQFWIPFYTETEP